jgi:hypothetical protein
MFQPRTGAVLQLTTRALHRSRLRRSTRARPASRQLNRLLAARVEYPAPMSEQAQVPLEGERVGHGEAVPGDVETAPGNVEAAPAGVETAPGVVQTAPDDVETAGGAAIEGSPTPAAANPAPQSFSVLRVLTTSLHVTKRNVAPFFVLACVLTVPSMLLQLSTAADDILLAFFVSTATNALAAAVVAYGVIMELYGSRPSARACIVTGFAQLPGVLGVTLVSTLAIAGAMLLLIVPGIIVAMMFYVVVPVTVVERVGIDAAMKRSRELTRGHKGELFLIALLGVAIGTAIELVAHYELGPQAAFVWRGVGQAASTMFFAVTTAVAYVELRKLRDGILVPEIATAFARVRK